MVVSYGDTPVVDELDITVGRGEAIALLGPSGSGKTTLLYAVAGFITPTAGSVRIAGEEVAGPGRHRPPERRRVGVVFQHYALWPHMTAAETVAYPLRRRGVAPADAERQARALLERLAIAALADRHPAELSGGQQQRVGLARALACDAGLYLFDEPTAHLDTPLRAALQEEMAERRQEAEAAALYATHDAAEALAVADRVALLRDGRLVQIGTPQQVYEQPVDLWAAELTGPAAVLQVDRVHRDDGARVRLGDVEVDVATDGAPATGGALRALVRPEWTALGGPLPGVVRRAWYRGPYTDYRVGTTVGEVTVRLPGPPLAHAGERVGWSLHRVWVLGSSGR